MRILFVTDFYHPYSGGVEIHVRTIAAELAARGHEVGVATIAAPTETPARRRDGDVAVFAVGHTAQRRGVGVSNTERPWAPPFPDPLAMRDLRRVVSSFEPDVIHGHDWLARSALPPVVSGSIPIVTSLHYYTRTCAKKTLWRDGAACPGPSLRTCLRCAADHYGRVRGPVVALGLRAGARLEDRRTRRWISVSEATSVGNGLTGRPDAVVIANPLAPTAAKLEPEAGPSDPLPRDLPAGDFMLYVGDLRPEKGLAVLAAAVAELRSTHRNDTPLVVAGERMSDELTMPEGTVELGPLAHEVIQALWRRATVGVIPSLWPEPFGLVAIEAMAAGCPVVASDTGGLSEILADGVARLVAPGDHRALATALHQLLVDREARAELSSRSIEAAQRYDLAPIVDAIEREYRAVLG